MSNVIWTRAMVGRLDALVKAGHPYKTIAAMLSGEFNVALTKNSCVGKGRRLGVPLRLPARKRRRCRKGNAPRNPARRNLQPSAVRSRPRPPKRRRSKSRKLQPARRNLSLLQLLPNSCRWPSGNIPDTTFCGDYQVAGSSYCLHHTLIASPGYGRAR